MLSNNGCWWYILIAGERRKQTISGSPEIHGICIIKPFKEEVEFLQNQKIIITLGDETSEWCNNFVLIPKLNGKVYLCLDPAILNQALITQIHKGPTLKDIFPNLMFMLELTLKLKLSIQQFKTRQEINPNNLCMLTSRRYVPEDRWDGKGIAKYMCHC